MKIEKVETFEIRQKGEYGMISNQILQTTLDGLKAITRIDLGICDTEGKVLASTFTDAEESESSILVFVDSPADSQVIQGYQFFI
jgi:carbohydrate diacid regulator